MLNSRGYAAQNAGEALAPFTFERRDPGPQDVVIDIQYCGVCHTDIHMTNNDWGMSTFPMVPGHEIVGRVVKVGSSVKKFKSGDSVGVGCMVDSCRNCVNCQDGQEQYCVNGMTLTYGSPEKHIGGFTYGGYSNNIVVDEAFVLKISSKLDIASTAPLLCAGITTYSPMRHWNVVAGQKVGVVGLGGLGHMALKFARSFDTHVVQFTTSPNKREDALRLGAHEVVLSRDEDAMKAHSNSFDFILDTVSAPHDLNALLPLLKRDGNLVLVGLPTEAPTVAPGGLIWARRSLAGSLIGGVRETQEMLDYCAERGITSDIEVIPIQKINEAFQRVVKADVKYRFVIDMKSLEKQ
jgi:uncharacterized zinc-type alcohol dehydrogenase-like protein